jgi:hypothetical protein
LTVPLARRLLESDAASELTPREFEKLGVPIVGHRGVVTACQEARDDGGLMRTVDLKLTWGDQELETTRRVVIPSAVDEALLNQALHFVDEHGEKFQKQVILGSVLDRLRELSDWLVRIYNFDAAQASWFILTDSPPRRPPLEGSVGIEAFPSHVEGRVTLSIDLWVPADMVLQAFREVQRHHLNRENRPLSRRNLAVFRSVVEDARTTERTNPGGPPPSRAQSMKRWNREHPEETYKQEWQFNRDIDRAERGVLFPAYRLNTADMEEDE